MNYRRLTKELIAQMRSLRETLKDDEESLSYAFERQERARRAAETTAYAISRAEKRARDTRDDLRDALDDLDHARKRGDDRGEELAIRRLNNI